MQITLLLLNISPGIFEIIRKKIFSHLLRNTCSGTCVCVCERERTLATVNFNLLQMFQYIFRNRTEQNENVNLKIEYNVLKIL